MEKDRAALVKKLAEPLAASLGLAVWGAECVSGGRPVLRLFVEKAVGEAAPAAGCQAEEGAAVSPDGVSVDECAELSRMLGLALDVEDSFDGAWVLEVSSPGLERVFFCAEQMRPYVGREVDAVLSLPHPAWPAAPGLPGRKKFRGTLLSADGDSFTLSIPQESRLPEDPQSVTIAWPDVRRVHLVHVFPEPGLPKKVGKAAKKAPEAV